ncbi:hypothetical protein Ancab_010138 [Ancistrocladus abbreviatus]
MRCENLIVKKPVVVEHESAGSINIIAEVGSSQVTLEVGDCVALEPGIRCRQSNLCKDGRFSLCGTSCKFHATSCPTLQYKRLEERAMCKPLSVGVHARDQANICPETADLGSWTHWSGD